MQEHKGGLSAKWNGGGDKSWKNSEKGGTLLKGDGLSWALKYQSWG